MMKKVFNPLLFLLVIALQSCSKDANVCLVSNPTENIEWLRLAIEEIKNDEFSYFGTATFKEETVFYYGNCNPVINYSSSILNCDGDNLGFTNDLFDELTDITIVWQHKDSKCKL